MASKEPTARPKAVFSNRAWLGFNNWVIHDTFLKGRLTTIGKLKYMGAQKIRD